MSEESKAVVRKFYALLEKGEARLEMPSRPQSHHLNALESVFVLIQRLMAAWPLATLPGR
jgi:hypothetical protein